MLEKSLMIDATLASRSHCTAPLHVKRENADDSGCLVLFVLFARTMMHPVFGDGIFYIVLLLDHLNQCQ
jgi:hypothetical protein